METKICNKCKEEKSLVEFHVRAKAKDGRCNDCKDCAKERSRLWNQANKERKAEAAKAYAKANKEKLKVYRKEYYENNKEEILEKTKAYKEENKERYEEYYRNYNIRNRSRLKEYKNQWYEDNKSRLRDVYKEYYESNKEEISRKKAEYNEKNRESIAEKKRAYRERNKDRINEYNKRRYALKKNLQVEKVCYKTIRERDATCYLCGVEFTAEERVNGRLTHIDHIIPLSRLELEPNHCYANCALTHARCNLQKNKMTPEEYFKWLGSFSSDA